MNAGHQNRESALCRYDAHPHWSRGNVPDRCFRRIEPGLLKPCVMQLGSTTVLEMSGHRVRGHILDSRTALCDLEIILSYGAGCFNTSCRSHPETDSSCGVFDAVTAISCLLPSIIFSPVSLASAYSISSILCAS
jgi:hypothetical protein